MCWAALLRRPTACMRVQKKRDLGGAEGHILLLEYLEERPLLLGRPGARWAARAGTMDAQ